MVDKKTKIDRMIRVDQAGEYGAARIYAGQLAVLKNTDAAPVIEEMADKEREHLEKFDHLMNARHVRPTLLGPIWHVAGFALGAATAMMGKKAAMACPEAVEEVIEDHYQAQSDALSKNPAQSDPELAAAITQAQADEADHRQRAINEGARQAPCHAPLTSAVRTGTRMAIWLSERI
ncbi:MAG: demethoxyubiquinone hydroxylase family protein [Rhodospirillales bacterium]|nr:demethoxyubiquinone hydroxylase family protein [Rhodospirillales bacterium]